MGPAPEVYLHVKFFPRFNDGVFVQHADDQINDGTGSGEPHENARTPIGEAIESYQGVSTVEVLIDGGVLYSERPIEQLKVVTWTPECYATYDLEFRLRAKEGSSTYVSIHQYVHIACMPCEAA